LNVRFVRHIGAYKNRIPARGLNFSYNGGTFDIHDAR